MICYKINTQPREKRWSNRNLTRSSSQFTKKPWEYIQGRPEHYYNRDISEIFEVEQTAARCALASDYKELFVYFGNIFF